MEKRPLRRQQTAALRDTPSWYWCSEPRCIVKGYEIILFNDSVPLRFNIHTLTAEKATPNCQWSQSSKQDIPRYMCQVSHSNVTNYPIYARFQKSICRIPIINLDSVFTSPSGQRNRTGRQENQYDYLDYFNFYGDDGTEGGEVEESSFPSGVGSDALPRDIYCDLANTLQSLCAGTVKFTVVLYP